MSTKKENRLYKRITIPETEIPLSLLLDFVEFSANRRDEIKKEVELLNTAYKSEYIERQPLNVRQGIQSAIDDAQFELTSWFVLYNQLNTIEYDNVH